MMVTKKCIFDILSLIANHSKFNITSSPDSCECYFPECSTVDLSDMLNDYSFETVSYCCYLLFKEKCIKAICYEDEKRNSFEIRNIQGLTLTGFNMLEKLKNEL